MSHANGTETRAALALASAWGTAVACGAGHGLLVRPHSIRKTRALLLDDSLGQPYSAGADQGAVTADGTLPCYLRYGGLDLALALAMGSTAGAPVQQGSTSAYARSLDVSASLDGLFATLAIANGVDVEEYPSAKISGYTLTGEVGRPLEVAFHVIASDRVTGSAVNTPAAFASVTLADAGHRVLMGQGVFRMNARDSAALGPSDRIHPSGFELTFKRKLRGVYGAGAPTDVIDEPTNDGTPEVRLKLRFPRYTSDAHFLGWDASSPMKLDMTFTGPVIEAPYARQFSVSLPNLAYAGVDLPHEAGIMSHPVEFACLGTGTPPAGMGGMVGPLVIGIVNTNNADVLA